jgi:hypothetical protein
MGGKVKEDGRKREKKDKREFQSRWKKGKRVKSCKGRMAIKIEYKDKVPVDVDSFDQ